MRFIHHSLGYLQAGEVVEVNLSGNAANVRLLDNANFSSYKSGRRHRYSGGLATKSPVHLAIPRSGNWHVAVDMMGLYCGRDRGGNRGNRPEHGHCLTSHAFEGRE